MHLEASLTAIHQAQEMARKADVNGDGQITASDITAITDVIFGKTDKITPEAADVNGDGSVTVADIIAVVNMIYSQLY
jgi:Ca2+-binding EF-hand superfamily protein